MYSFNLQIVYTGNGFSLIIRRTEDISRVVGDERETEYSNTFFRNVASMRRGPLHNCIKALDFEWMIYHKLQIIFGTYSEIQSTLIYLSHISFEIILCDYHNIGCYIMLSGSIA